MLSVERESITEEVENIANKINEIILQEKHISKELIFDISLLQNVVSEGKYILFFAVIWRNVICSNIIIA